MRLQVKVIKRAITAAFLGLALMLSALSATSQTYDFTPITGSFATIIGTTGIDMSAPTLVGLSSRDNNADDGVYNTINIPFEFYFFGRRIESLVPTTNLWLTTNTGFRCDSRFGRGCTSTDLESIDHGTSTYNHQGAIYPFWTDSHVGNSGQVHHLTEDDPVTGGKIFTIEFSQFPGVNRATTSNLLSMQVKLFEVTGNIEFHYGSIASKNLSSGVENTFIGIAGSARFLTDSDATRYYSVQSLGSTPTASDSMFTEFPRNRGDDSSTDHDDRFPIDGQIYRFAPNQSILLTPAGVTAHTGESISRVLPALIYPKGTVTYDLTGLPTGLPTGSGFSFDDDERTLTGMSASAFTATPLTYTATDNTGTHTTTFMLTVLDTLGFGFGSQTIENIDAVPASAIESRTLPQVVRGVAPITYSLSPALPSGLTFQDDPDLPNFLRLSGTPTRVVNTTTYTYTATDSTDTTPLTDTIEFTITVAPVFLSPGPQKLVFVVGESGGSAGKLRFTHADGSETGLLFYDDLSPSLPVGIVFDGDFAIVDSGTQFISDGIEDTAAPNGLDKMTYTYTPKVIAPRSSLESNTFTLEVFDVMPVAPTDPMLRFAVGQDIPVNTVLPVFENNIPDRLKPIADNILPSTYTPTFTYELTGSEIPSWLDFDRNTRALSTSVPVAAVDGGEFDVTYTASEGAGRDSESITFTITVTNDRIPEVPDPAIMNFVFTPGDDVDEELPPFTGGNGVLIHKLFLTSDSTMTQITSFDVMLDLDYISGTRTIIGTIPATNGDDMVDPISYTYTATDSDTTTDPDTVPVMFTISVIDEMPDFTGMSITNIDVIQNSPIPVVTLPEVVKDSDNLPIGTGAIMYEVTQEDGTSRPEWLMFNEVTRVLTGTPDAVLSGDDRMFRYTATDKDMDVATIDFTITAAEDRQPVAPFTPPADPPGFTFTVGGTISSESGGVEPLAFTDGNGDLMYALAAGTTFPDGLDLSLHPDTAALSGTFDGTSDPDSAGPTTYTYTATDEDGDPVNSTFTLTLIDPLPLVPTNLDLEFVPGDDLTANPVELPSFTGGNTSSGPLTYSLTNAAGNAIDNTTNSLIADLMYNQSNRMITGMIDIDTTADDSVPALADPAPVYIYTATDNDGDEVSTTFTIRVIDPRPVEPVPAIGTISFVKGEDDSQTLRPFATTVDHNPDITVPIVYSLDPATPFGLVFDPDDRTLTGTMGNPTFEGEDSSMDMTVTYRATAGLDVVDHTFTILVTDDPVPELSEAIPNNGGYTFRVGDMLPRTSTGTGREPEVLPNFRIPGDDDGSSLTHSLTDASGNPLNPANTLIGGLMYDSDSRTIHGTVFGDGTDNDVAATTYTYSAVETEAPDGQDNDTGETTFTITIVDDMPDFTGMTITTIDAIQNSMFPAVTLPEVVKNTEDPPEPIGTGMITYVVTQEDGTPAPSWLDFNMDSRALTGTPTAVLSEADSMFRYTATDEDMDTDNIDFTINVAEDVPPVIPPTIAPIVLNPGDNLTVASDPGTEDPVTLPVFTGGNGMFIYSLDNPGDLAQFNLSFNAVTRQLTGMLPDDTDVELDVSAVQFTYIAVDTEDTATTDDDDPPVPTTFTIAIDDTVPQAPTGPQAYTVTVGMELTAATQDTAATIITLEEFTSGDGMLVYAAETDPILPTGLTFDPDSREIRGEIVDTAGDQSDENPVEYTYSATDSGGDGDTANATFTLQVKDPVPSFDTSEERVNVVPDWPAPACGDEDERIRFPDPATEGNNPPPRRVTNPPFNSKTGAARDVGLRILQFLPDHFICGGDRVIADTAGNETGGPFPYTLTVTDAGGDEAIFTYNIYIIDAKPVAPPMVDYSFNLGVPIADVTLPEFANPEKDQYPDLPHPEFSYSVSGLPSGLNFDSASRVISGTLASAGPHMITYTATEVADSNDNLPDGADTASVSFNITGITIAFGSSTVPDIEATVRTSNINVVLPELTGGSAATTYAISPALPTGLTFTAATRLLSGTVTGSSINDSGPTTYTYTATDTGLSPMMLDFTITITDEVPAFADGAMIPNIIGTQDMAITPVTVPELETAGTGEITYSFNPELPAWLSHNTETGMLEGTPTVNLTQTTYKYRATDEDGDYVELIFTVGPETDTTFVRPPVPNLVLTVGQMDDSNILPAFTGGTGVLTHSLTLSSDPNANLPSGLNFNPTDRTITVSGTSNDDTLDATSFTYAVRDEAGDNDSFSFTIQIIDEVPEFSDEEDENTEDIDVFTGNQIMETLPATTGTGTVMYTLTPEFPAGLDLMFTPSSRVLTGTPLTGLPTTTYTYTATDMDGDTDTIEFDITLEVDTDPVAPVPPRFTFTVRKDIRSVNGVDTGLAFLAGNGNGDLTYSQPTPDLPLGLSFNTSTAALSGTPTGTPAPDGFVDRVFRYTATDEDGDAVNSIFTITLIDSLPVVPANFDRTLEFVPGDDLSLTGSNFVTLPAFTGGTTTPSTPLTYSLTADAEGMNVIDNTTHSLIAGLVYDQTTLTISGIIADDIANPDGTADDNSVMAVPYTYTATDNDGDAVSTTVTLAVVDVVPVAPVLNPFEVTRGETIAANTMLQDFDDNIPPGSGITRPPFTYSLMGNPSWFTLESSSSRVVSEMMVPDIAADAEGAVTDVTYIATDANGIDSASVTFALMVVASARPTLAGISGGGYTFVVGETETRQLPVASVSGGGAVTYRLALAGAPDTPITTLADPQASTPSPLSAFTFDPDPASGPPTISGTFAGTDGDDSVAATNFVYFATNADGVDSLPVPFTITIVDEIPMFASDNNTITVSNAIVRSAFTEEAFPEVVKNSTNEPIGTGMITYEVTEADGTDRPSWLMFDAETRVLSGTPTDALSPPDNMFAYTATDEDMDVATIMFTFTVAADPELTAPTIQPLVYVVGRVRQTISVTLDPFTGENGMLTYTLSNTQELMDDFGLSFNADNLMITGNILFDTTDNQNVALRTFTYTATDDDNTPAIGDDDTESTPITIQIIDPVPVAPSGNLNRTFNLDMDVSYELPAFMTNVDDNDAVATPTLTYTVTEADDTPRPEWLEFNAGTRVLSGELPAEIVDGSTINLSYTADEDGAGAADTLSVPFTLTFTAEALPLEPPTAPQAYTFNAGDQDSITLEEFTGGNLPLTYTLQTTPALPMGLSMAEDFATSRMISGRIPNSASDDRVSLMTYTYTATAARDADGVEATESATFTITVTDDNITRPIMPQVFVYEPGEVVSETLLPFTGGNTSVSGALTYSLNPSPDLPSSLTFTPATRLIAGTIDEDAESSVDATEYTYTATDDDDEMESATFTIQITDAPTLDMATASAIPTLGANIALVASQAISSRVELALNGLSSGIDIRTLDGPSLRLNPQQQNGGSSGSPVRFGVWYSAASDSLSDSRGDVAWEGTTDSTNLGFDVGFDISASASLVVGILQNSSSTSATYRNTTGGSDGTLSVDLDSTAFYVGLGYDWLDAWFANGSADSTLNDSITMMAIPASFSYQTIGLTASFEVADSFNIGGKVESLTSDLSLAAMADDNYVGLSTDSSQLRTAFVANYQLKLGENGNGLLIPKFEFGFRDLSLGSSIQENFTAAGGSAMETGFGIDYLQRAWGLTVGLDIRSISVENYSSDSTQYQIRWESGNYGNGLSFQLTPHSVSETLGGIDSLYSGGYNQYQSVLERQRGGSSTQDSKGMDFEVGYGFVASYGTVTPYLKTTNYRGIGNRAQEFGIRYQTLSGLELTLRAERELTPQTLQILGFPLTFMQQERALTFNTRYSF